MTPRHTIIALRASLRHVSSSSSGNASVPLKPTFAPETTSLPPTVVALYKHYQKHFLPEGVSATDDVITNEHLLNSIRHNFFHRAKALEWVQKEFVVQRTAANAAAGVTTETTTRYNVLEIGTNSGLSTVMLSEIFDGRAKILSMDRVPSRVEQATKIIGSTLKDAVRDATTPQTRARYAAMMHSITLIPFDACDEAWTPTPHAPSGETNKQLIDRRLPEAPFDLIVVHPKLRSFASSEINYLLSNLKAEGRLIAPVVISSAPTEAATNPILCEVRAGNASVDAKPTRPPPNGNGNIVRLCKYIEGKNGALLMSILKSNGLSSLTVPPPLVDCETTNHEGSKNKSTSQKKAKRERGDSSFSPPSSSSSSSTGDDESLSNVTTAAASSAKPHPAPFPEAGEVDEDAIPPPSPLLRGIEIENESEIEKASRLREAARREKLRKWLVDWRAAFEVERKRRPTREDILNDEKALSVFKEYSKDAAETALASAASKKVVMKNE